MEKKGNEFKKITHIDDFQHQARRRVPKMFYDYVDSGSWTGSTYRANEVDLQQLLFRQRVAVNIEQRSTQSQLLGQTVAMPLALSPTGLTGMQHADGEILAAQAANCSALVVTLDLQVLGQRHKDIKNGLSTPPKPTLRNIINLATKPYWCAQMLQTKRRSFGNIVGHAKGVSDLSSLATWTAEQFDPTLCWDDIAWIKARWGGKLILKGIMEPEDAQHAVDAGADGTMIGRAFLYALGAAGQAEVERCLEIFQNEFSVSMALCGKNSVSEVDRRILLNPTIFDRT